jgi:hypothetical protein
MKYKVGVKIYNSFEVEADSEEEAEEKVRELDVYATLRECDLNICYVDEVKEKSIVDGMVEDLINLHYENNSK